MKPRVAISIESGCVRAVAARRTALVAAACRTLANADTLPDVIRDLLRDVAVRGRFEARIVIGPACCQTRECTDLPPGVGRKAFRSLVHNHVSTLFRRAHGGLIAVSRASGVPWAEYFDSAVATQAVQACASAGARVTMVVSVPTALAAAVRDGSFTWIDRDVRLVATCRDGMLASHQRSFTDAFVAGDRDDDVEGRVDLSAVTGARSRFAPAAGALRLRQPVPLGLNPSALVERPALPAWRVHLAAATVAGVLVVGAVAPWGMLRMIAARDASAVEVVAPLVRRAEAQRATIERTESGLEVIRDFIDTRTDWNAILAELAATLPLSAAISDFRADSSGGRIVVLADRAIDVVAALETARVLLAAGIDGTVTRDRLGERNLERATVRFALPAGK